jgi:hypothetical protein
LQTRIQTGATAAALSLAIAAISEGNVRVIMLVVTGAILLATFADKVAFLERLPGIGAPRISAEFERKQGWASPGREESSSRSRSTFRHALKMALLGSMSRGRCVLECQG